MGRPTGRPTGRPRTVEKVRAICSAGDGCQHKNEDGTPGTLERYPSQVPKSGVMYHDVSCRNGRGPTEDGWLKGYCQNPNHPTDEPWEFKYPAKRGHQSYCGTRCYLMTLRTAQVIENTCRWCGKPVRTFASTNLQYHTTEAPEPECGWPEGVRLTCWDFGRYKNLAKPLRIVNGKPVRMYFDRKRNAERVQVWDPERKDGKGEWSFEHRWDWEQRYGVKLTSATHIHHRDENKQNNQIDNYQAVTPSEHMALHQAERKRKLAEHDAAVAEAARSNQDNARLRTLLEAAGIDPDAPDVANL